MFYSSGVLKQTVEPSPQNPELYPPWELFLFLLYKAQEDIKSIFFIEVLSKYIGNPEPYPFIVGLPSGEH